MLEFLNYMMIFPIWFPGLFILLSIVFFTVLVWNFIQNRKWNPEGKIFIKARKSGYPVICLHALNGFFQFFLGEKDKKGSPIFKHDADTLMGIHFDPRIQNGSVPKSYTRGGLEMLHYGTNSPFALSANNAQSQKTILDHVRKNYQILSTLPDQLVLEYVGRDRADLPHDCANLAKVFDLNIMPDNDLVKGFVEDYRKALADSDSGNALVADEIDAKTNSAMKQYILDFRSGFLTKTFQQIQDETLQMPIKSNRFFSFVEAFQNISSAFSAVDIQNFLQLFEMLAKLNDQQKFERLLMMISAIGFAVLLVLVGVYVVGLNK